MQDSLEWRELAHLVGVPGTKGKDTLRSLHHLFTAGGMKQLPGAHHQCQSLSGDPAMSLLLSKSAESSGCPLLYTEVCQEEKEYQMKGAEEFWKSQ